MTRPIHDPICRDAAELCEAVIDAILATRLKVPYAGSDVALCVLTLERFRSLDPSACEPYHRFAFRELQAVVTNATIGFLGPWWDAERLATGVRVFRDKMADIERPERTADELAAIRRAGQAPYLRDAHRENARAVETLGTDATRKQLYAWLKEHATEGYELPVLSTFLKYVRQSKKLAGAAPTPMAVGPGRSVVQRDQL